MPSLSYQLRADSISDPIFLIPSIVFAALFVGSLVGAVLLCACCGSENEERRSPTSNERKYGQGADLQKRRSKSRSRQRPSDEEKDSRKRVKFAKAVVVLREQEPIEKKGEKEDTKETTKKASDRTKGTVSDKPVADVPPGTEKSKDSELPSDPGKLPTVLRASGLSPPTSAYNITVLPGGAITKKSVGTSNDKVKKTLIDKQQPQPKSDLKTMVSPPQTILRRSKEKGMTEIHPKTHLAQMTQLVRTAVPMPTIQLQSATTDTATPPKKKPESSLVGKGNGEQGSKFVTATKSPELSILRAPTPTKTKLTPLPQTKVTPTEVIKLAKLVTVRKAKSPLAPTKLTATRHAKVVQVPPPTKRDQPPARRPGSPGQVISKQVGPNTNPHGIASYEVQNPRH